MFWVEVGVVIDMLGNFSNENIVVKLNSTVASYKYGCCIVVVSVVW